MDLLDVVPVGLRFGDVGVLLALSVGKGASVPDGINQNESVTLRKHARSYHRRLSNYYWK